MTVLGKSLSAALWGALLAVGVPHLSAQPGPGQSPARPLQPRQGVQKAAAPRLPDLRVDTERYPDGSTKKLTPTLDGKLHGEVKVFWPGGVQLKSLTRYERGLRQGVSETYFENGRIETRVPYRNDRMEGVFERWDNPGPKRDAYGAVFQPVVVEQVSYVNGQREGVAKTWRRINNAHSGELASESPYRNDRLHGRSCLYGPGEGRTERNYVDGKLHGVETRTSATGRLDIRWEDDRKHGLTELLMNRYDQVLPTWQEEWSHGALLWRKEYGYFLLGGSTKVKKIEVFDNAHRLHGRSEFWSGPDKREKTLEYADGLQHGFADYYDATGTRVVRREVWRKGVKVGEAPVP